MVWLFSAEWFVVYVYSEGEIGACARRCACVRPLPTGFDQVWTDMLVLSFFFDGPDMVSVCCASRFAVAASDLASYRASALGIDKSGVFKFEVLVREVRRDISGAASHTISMNGIVLYLRSYCIRLLVNGFH